MSNPTPESVAEAMRRKAIEGHTPKPWHVSEYKDGSPATLYRNDDEDEVDIATFEHAEIFGEELEDTVRLIATAPDLQTENQTLTATVRVLKEALKECANELDDYYRAEYRGEHPYHVKKRDNALACNPARPALALVADIPEEES